MLFSPVILELVSSVLTMSLQRWPYGSEDGGNNSFMFPCLFTWNSQCACICVCLCIWEIVFKLCTSIQTHSVCNIGKRNAAHFHWNGVKTQTEGAVAPRDHRCHLAQHSSLPPPPIWSASQLSVPPNSPNQNNLYSNTVMANHFAPELFDTSFGLFCFYDTR